ncbi:Bax inhibitor-1/YccA family protein [Dietzia sp. CH92]|uniref:Bax inhibitor-1/YccA family protein n=1 Tax=Dietzia sp. CH92 TaxID=3051823 RepID=UPI0028D84C32|nr:Bax inhibitor-1/YccA family protein [Dietzia sp. CH92]
MRSSSNPVFSSLSTDSARGATQFGAAGRGAFQQGQYGQAGYGAQPGYGAPQAHSQFAADTRPMTIDDVVSKTGITLGVIGVVGLIAYFLSVDMGLAMPLLLVGGIGGFITVLVATFGRKMDSAPVTLIYAAFEGLFIGAVSHIFTFDIAGADAAAVIGQAVLGTFGVFGGMLFVYKTGAVRVTPKFTRFMTAALIGVLVLMVGNLFGALLFGFNPLRDGGMIAIVFSLVCIGLAAFSFLLDFDNADRLVRAGAPAKMAWGVALGLAVTLVWLYVEILRLMSYFRE